MKARYRTIHFVPDPFRETRVPIGAVVQDRHGHLFRERAEHIPGPICLGGRRSATLVQVGLSLLDAATFDGLPGSMGPFFVLGGEREVPMEVDDPARWVRERVLPKKPFDADDLSDRKPSGPQRVTYGNQFFKTWKVEQYVHRKYDGQALGVPVQAAHSIAHWVAGKDRLLLMEPVVMTRVDPVEDLRQVSQTFLAWQSIFANRNARRPPTFIAYIIGGRSGGVWEQARSVLAESKAEIVDVDIPSMRSKFLDTIRDVGSSAPKQSGFGLN